MYFLQTTTGIDAVTAINNLSTNLDIIETSFIPKILMAAKTLAVVFVIIHIGIKVIKMMINPDNTIVPHILVRPLLILGALVLYQPLIELLLSKPADLVNEIITDAGGTVSGNYNQDFVDAITHIQDSGGSLASSSGIYDILQTNPLMEFIHLLIYFIASIAGTFIQFMQLVVSQFYYIIGVIVLPFAIVPGNESALSKWFFGYLSVLLWLPILNIIKIIIAAAHTGGPQTYDNPLLSIAYQVVMILFVFSIPKLSSIIVSAGSEIGQGAVGSVQSAVRSSTSTAARGMKAMRSSSASKSAGNAGSSPSYGKG